MHPKGYYSNSSTRTELLTVLISTVLLHRGPKAEQSELSAAPSPSEQQITEVLCPRPSALTFEFQQLQAMAKGFS